MIPFLQRFRKSRPVAIPAEPDPTEREAADPGPAASDFTSRGPETAGDLAHLAIRIALLSTGCAGNRSLYLLELSDLQLACFVCELRRALPPGVFSAVSPAGDHKWALEVWRQGVKA